MSQEEVDVPVVSYEARWFESGPIPPELIHAFQRPGPWAPSTEPLATGPAPPRTDRYLPISSDLGVKIMDASGPAPRIEFKGRIVENRPFGWAGMIRGDAAGWVKWSFPDGGPGLARAWSERSGSVDVVKHRRLRLVRLGADPVELQPKSPVERGLQLELTRVLRRPFGPPAESEHWTFSVEAFPYDPALPDEVRAVVAPWLESWGPAAAVLRGARCASYPEWLAG